jgi:LemA protein
MRSSRLAAGLATALLLSGCGYQTLQRQSQQADAAAAELQQQYRQRGELVAILLDAVKNYAAQEPALNEMIEAHTRLGNPPAANLSGNAEAFAQSLQMQTKLSAAVSHLLTVSANDPRLRADAAFRELQAQLVGDEGRIALAEERYTAAAQNYNATVHRFPSNLTAMLLRYKTRPMPSPVSGGVAAQP